MKKNRRNTFVSCFNSKTNELTKKELHKATNLELQKREFFRLLWMYRQSAFNVSNPEWRRMYDKMRWLWKKFWFTYFKK